MATRKFSRWAASAMYILTFVCAAISQTALTYRLRTGKKDADGFPATAAQICFGPEIGERCYTPPEENPPFGLDPKSRAVKLDSGAQMVLFTAESSAGGSGSLTILALLEARDGQVTNLLPKVAVTNQSEYDIWSLPRISAMPVLVTADFVWAKGETHFSPHRYRITAYAYDKQTGRYIEQVNFTTEKMYPGLDDVNDVDVLKPEKAEIVAKLTHP
jgi:hypothetical protein